jgi:hypothetical protein
MGIESVAIVIGIAMVLIGVLLVAALLNNFER